MECRCQACEDSGRKIDANAPITAYNPVVDDQVSPMDLKQQDLTLELEWFKPNGITVLPNSKETRITSNTYVFLNMFIMHPSYGIINMEPSFINNEPQVKIVSNPDWCAKCNRELISYSPKTAPFSYCRITRKLLGKFRLICSSNSHFIDKQLITITARVRYGNTWLEKSIHNIRINSKKPRDETDPTSFKPRRKRKSGTPGGSSPPQVSGITLDTVSPNSGPSVGNTAVTLRGQFSESSEVMFGSMKLKPFIQKSENDEEDINTLVVYSPPGVPGASVQVYVKDGDKSSSAQYFVYTFKPEKDEKVKVDDYSAQVVRDLANKYVQLEQVVMTALAQNGNNYKGGQDYTVLSFVLKNVLMEIFHAKAVINDLENGKHFPRLDNDMSKRRKTVPEVFLQQADEIAMQNQILSKKIFTQFAIPVPQVIPPVRIPYDATTHDIAYDFGAKTNPRRDQGLDKLVAAIETLEKPYP